MICINLIERKNASRKNIESAINVKVKDMDAAVGYSRSFDVMMK
jgi:hypothetical protein